MENEMEITIAELIVHAGDARSLAIQAIRLGRKGEFTEAGGSPVPLSLLMVHAQDHVMNAMTVRDMAVEMVAMMKELAQR